MTTITKSLSEYVQNFDVPKYKEKAKALAARFFTLYPFPDESRFKTIIRTAFEALAAFLVIGTFVAGLVPLAIGFTIYRGLQPPSNYVIKPSSNSLGNATIALHVKRLIETQRRFQSLDIRMPPNLEFTPSTIDLLKELKPKALIVPAAANSEKIADSLETFTHFYQKSSSSTPTSTRLELKEKIHHLVLPSNPDEMLRKLTYLAGTSAKVDKLYYTSVVPQNMQKTVVDLVSKLKPSLEVLIDNKDKHSIQTLEALLYV